MRAHIDFPLCEEASGRWRASFDAPVAVLDAWHPGEVRAVLAQVEAHAGAGRWCLGGLAYEAAAAFDPALCPHASAPLWPLARFAVYEQCQPWPQAGDAATPASDSPWLFSMTQGDYLARCQQARQAMAAGECYQINLTGALQSTLAGDPHAWMEALRRAQPDAYLLWLDWGGLQVLSASPELFFDWQPEAAGGRVMCRPMKGTAPRHADAVRDADARAQLLASPKERAENVMIVDLLRNDLGRLARPGTVRVPRLFEAQALPTVWQMTSTVTARTTPGVGLAELFGALFPCGSVTGAPKARAMHWIRALEDGPRGFYCGALGVVRPGGAATFNVPIRTLSLQRDPASPGGAWSARYGVGSGVTVYAEPQAEWRELAAKARLLERVSRPFDLLETLRLEDGRYWLLERHLERMASSARYFGFAWDADREAAVRAQLDAVAREHAQGLWRLRLLLAARGQASVQAFALAATPEPVRVALAVRPLDTQGGQHEFVLHKTTRRAHYDAFAPAQAEVFDTLLVNERGELTEFTRGNAALRIEGQWRTPPLQCGLLPGTYRAELLAQGRLVEAVLTPADLQRAGQIAFFNGLRGWLRAQWVGA